MTEQEALQKATEKWGRGRGGVQRRHDKDRARRFVVGTFERPKLLQGRETFFPRGVGASWEEAFSDADARKIPDPEPAGAPSLLQLRDLAFDAAEQEVEGAKRGPGGTTIGHIIRMAQLSSPTKK